AGDEGPGIYNIVNPFSATTSGVNFTSAGVNTTYYFMVVPVNAAGEAVGCMEISYTTPGACPPPANDVCAGAYDLTVDGGVITGNHISATPDGPAMACAFNADPVEGDVWFSFVAPMSGTLEIETSTGSILDTQIQVLDACGGTVVDCNDDSNGLYSLITLDCN